MYLVSNLKRNTLQLSFYKFNLKCMGKSNHNTVKSVFISFKATFSRQAKCFSVSNRHCVKYCCFVKSPGISDIPVRLQSTDMAANGLPDADRKQSSHHYGAVPYKHATTRESFPWGPIKVYSILFYSNKC